MQRNIVCLKLHRADVAKIGVASTAIVEHFNVLEYFTGRLGPCPEQGLVNELDFLGREETLSDRITPKGRLRTPSNCPCGSCYT